MMNNAISVAIAKILMTEWDPIGVGDVPAAKDEYEAYVEPVAELLLARKSTPELSGYLLDVERKNMGLRADPERAMKVAERLLALTK